MSGDWGLEEEESEEMGASGEVKTAMVEEELAGRVSNVMHEENEMGLTSEEEG